MKQSLGRHELTVRIVDTGKEPYTCHHAGCKAGHLQQGCRCLCSSCTTARVGACGCAAPGKGCTSAFCPCICRCCSDYRAQPNAPRSVKPLVYIMCAGCEARTSNIKFCTACLKVQADAQTQGVCKGCYAAEVPSPSLSWLHPQHCTEACMKTSAAAAPCTFCNACYRLVDEERCARCQREFAEQQAAAKRLAKKPTRAAKRKAPSANKTARTAEQEAAAKQKRAASAKRRYKAKAEAKAEAHRLAEMALIQQCNAIDAAVYAQFADRLSALGARHRAEREAEREASMAKPGVSGRSLHNIKAQREAEQRRKDEESVLRKELRKAQEDAQRQGVMERCAKRQAERSAKCHTG